MAVNNRVRYNNYDLLRILCTFGVIFLHMDFQNNVFRRCMASMGELSVSCFIMLSGALVMENYEIQESYAKWLYKVWKKLLLPWLFAIILYILEGLIFQIKDTGIYDFSVELNSFRDSGFPVRGWHLWFMYAFTVIYLIVPVLKAIKKKSIIIYFALVIPLWVISICVETSKYWYTTFLGYMWLYISGDIVRTYLSDIKKIYKIICFAITFCLTVYKLADVIADLNGSIFLSPYYSQLLLVMIMISINNINISKNLYVIAKMLMGIYLMHIFIGDMISAVLIAVGLNNIDTWWMSIGYACVVFFGAYVALIILKKLMRVVQNRITYEIK